MNKKELEIFKEGFNEGYEMAIQNYSSDFWYKFPEKIPANNRLVVIITDNKAKLVHNNAEVLLSEAGVGYWKYIELPEEVRKEIKNKK